MLSFPPVVMAHTVAVFLSFDGELDTQPLIEQLWRAGKRVYLPVLHPFSHGNLLFLHYHPQSALVTNRLRSGSHGDVATYYRWQSWMCW